MRPAPPHAGAFPEGIDGGALCAAPRTGIVTERTPE